MSLRESPMSIQLYLIMISMLAGYMGVKSVDQATDILAAAVLSRVQFFIALLFFLTGLFYRYLLTKPYIITTVLVTCAVAITASSWFYFFSVSANMVVILRLFLYLGIMVYLYANTRRMSSRQREEAPAAAPPRQGKQARTKKTPSKQTHRKRK